MPLTIKSPCAKPGCGALVESGYCEQHKPKTDIRRGNSTARGYNWKWRRERKRFIEEQFLAGHIFCRLCQGILWDQSDIEIDHIVPHRGNQTLFWDRNNWQLAHQACHSKKTASGE